MKRLYLYIIVILLLWGVGCTKDETMDFESATHGSVIEFSHHDFETLSMGTRGLAEMQSEWRVDNVYVCIFETEGNLQGKRLYSHTFQYKDLVANKQQVQQAGQKECWWVHNKTSVDDAMDTEGCLNLKIPTMKSANIYVVTNVHLLDLSPELLDVQTSSEENLHNLFVSSSSTSLYRTGLIMTGMVQGIKTVGNSITTADGGIVNVLLKRIDARIQVNVKINPKREAGDKRPFLRAFHPVKWELINMPKNMRLAKDEIADKIQEPQKYQYFDVPATNFETATDLPETNIFNEKIVRHGFGFYMLENLQPTSKVDCKSFHDRDIRLKNEDGTHVGTKGDIWVNAPEKSTYMKISGQLEMIQRKVEGGGVNSRQLFADVVYYIHLGCGNKVVNGVVQPNTSDYNDFSVRRNTSYTYNITINGVDSLMVEVETSRPGKPEGVREPEPSATGDTFEALESYYKFDSHYSQRAFRFRATHMKPNPEEGNRIKLTWYVETPFSEGSPLQLGAGSLDYKWVKFLRNKTVTGTDGVVRYSHRNRYYPGDDYNAKNPNLNPENRLMNVDEFTNYLIQQAYIYWGNKVPGAEPQANDFLPETIDGEEDFTIWFTLFIDEYYYDKHPISGAPIRWSEFVNGRDRMMHLLCDNSRSLDLASSVTQSVTTIRQRPIQTPYDVGTTSGLYVWGVETINEPQIIQPNLKEETLPSGEVIRLPVAESYPTWFFSEDDKTSGTTNNGVSCTDYNGKVNTDALLNLTNKTWSSALNVEKHGSSSPADWELPENDQPFLTEGQRTLLNSVLMRNRDANGDDKITSDEIKWYIGSVDQLTVFYMGDTGVAGDAKFFPPSKVNQIGQSWTAPPAWANIGTASFQGAPKWRSHIVTSTVPAVGDGPSVMWAEEGLSLSRYSSFDFGHVDLLGDYEIRCLRNLGVQEPQLNKVVIKKVDSQGNYYFDLRRLNRESLRHRGERVDVNINILDPSNELGENSYLPLGLETGPYIPLNEVKQKIGFQDNSGWTPERRYRELAHQMHQALQRGTTICPEGYRVLNVREAGLLCAYCPESWWSGKSTLPSTYWSFGEKIPANGNNGVDGHKITWMVGYRGGGKMFTMDIAGVEGVRCVRDLDPYTFDWTGAQ